MKQTMRKHLSVLLALVMVLTLLPAVTVTAWAGGPTGDTTGSLAGNVAINNTTPTDTTPTDVPATSDLETPLTLEAKTDGTILVKNPKDGMEYSINGGTKQAVTDEITVSAGNTVAFYGAADCYDGTVISDGTAQCYIYGNIMSLIDATNFASATALTKACAFYSFFEKNACLFSHPDRKLVLPATTLAESCYVSMFADCASLTTAPELPATTLAEGCYAGMFADCTGLTTAPELPATALAEVCYMSMFYGCTGLTTAPALPATTLAESCYMSMFSGCENLNAVTCLATDISASNATLNWLSNVPSSGTFTKASGTDWPTDSVSGIPEGWTAVDYSDSSTTSVSYLDAQVDDTTHAVTYTPATCTDYTPVASATDAVTWGTAGETTWYVVQEDATIDNTVTFTGDVRLILCDGATLTVNSVTQYGNAITNSGSGSLTVYAQSTDENAGELKATAQGGSAILADGCAVTINGGKVTATTGADNTNRAGLQVSGAALTINGGVVNASAPDYCNGIRADGAPVTINGGAVTAESHQGVFLNSTDMMMHGGALVANSEDFTGIYTYDANITVTGGDLTVTSKSNGIYANNITISGGSVEIDSAGYAAIYASKTVTISGGSVEATGKTYGIMTWNGDVTFTGGDVAASATNAENAMAVNSQLGAVVIGPGLRVDAGDDESAAVKVTKTFPETHDQKWAHIYEITNSTYTLTIPAAVTVSGAGWNATGGVSATGELAKGKKLTVTAASGDDFALVCQGKGQIGYYLAATATDIQPTTTWTFTALDDDPATQPMGVIVSETDFSSARPGTYTDTVTFTAQVEDADPLQKLTVPAYVWSDEMEEDVQVDVDFYYMAGETWKQAIENHPTENAGWSTFDDSDDIFTIKGEKYTDVTRGINNFIMYDDNADLVNFDLEIDPTGKYTLVNTEI